MLLVPGGCRQRVVGTGRADIAVVFGALQLCGICFIAFPSTRTPGVFTLPVNSGMYGEGQEPEGFFVSGLFVLKVFLARWEFCSEAPKVAFSSSDLKLVE